MNWVRKAYEGMCRAEESMAQALLVVTVTVVLVSAVARTARYPIAWGMEMATFLFAWAVFLSADVAMREDRHVAVDYFVNKLPETARHVIKVINYLIILAFLVFLMAYGVSMTYFTRFRAFQGIPGFSYMWVTASVPLGSLLLGVTTARRIAGTMEAIRKARRARSRGQPHGTKAPALRPGEGVRS